MRLFVFTLNLLIFLGIAVPAQAVEPEHIAEEHIVLATASGNIDGSLQLPAKSGKIPVVLFISGSGPTDRDGNSALIKGKNNSLKMLSDSLVQAGFATVRFDKRGIAKSLAAGTDESALRFETYVQDAAAWLKMLKADARFSDIAVLGHSEGSLIGILAAKQEPVKAVVSVAGVAKNAADVLLEQFSRKNLPPALAKTNEEILLSLKAGKLVTQVPPEFKLFYRDSIQTYLISWFRYTAEKEIGKLSCPVLVVQGDSDVQIDVAQARALVAAKPNADLLLVHDMNHVLKNVTGDPASQMPSYGDPSLPLPSELTEGIRKFLLAKLK